MKFWLLRGSSRDQRWHVTEGGDGHRKNSKNCHRHRHRHRSTDHFVTVTVTALPNALSPSPSPPPVITVTVTVTDKYFVEKKVVLCFDNHGYFQNFLWGFAPPPPKKKKNSETHDLEEPSLVYTTAKPSFSSGSHQSSGSFFMAKKQRNRAVAFFKTGVGYNSNLIEFLNYENIKIFKGFALHCDIIIWSLSSLSD